jgi:RHS repeat-associated protein
LGQKFFRQIECSVSTIESSAHRLIKTTDADLKQTQFEYNARSQMTAVIDALTQRYDFTYDALGRQLTQTKAGSTMAYEYDAVGNRTKRTDYLSQITNYTYDNLNRLTNITYPDATENITLTYDVISQLTKATKNAQDITFVYDKRRQVTSTTDIFGKIVASVYDASGNRTTLKLDGTNFATYAYDVANRLTKITNSADAKAVSYTYDNANRMTKETLPNTIATTFNYDGMSRLTKLKDVKGTTTLFDRNYTYNTANQISQIAETAQARNFGYDNLDRLTSVTGSTSENYAFDAVGNRTSSQLSATYSYQPFNRLTNTSNTSYVYNSNGNMVSKTIGANTTQFYWDYENRLKQVILPSGQNVVYKYDAFGRRTERNVNNSTSWTKFTYDGQDVILDQNSDGTSVTYLNGVGIDNKLRQTVNGQAQYFLSDHLGSTNALTDATGAVIASTNYDSFGNATNASFPTRYQYTGREFDSLTGLQYSRARWYDANLGRFISEDPIGFRGGDINLFGYVKNNPIRYNDPWGTQRADRDRPGDMYPGMREPYKPGKADLINDLACPLDGYNPWIQIEGGVFSHIITLGGGAAEGVMLNVLTGEICFYSHLQEQFGLGLYGGVGIKIGGMLGRANGSNNFDANGMAVSVDVNVDVDLAAGGGVDFPFRIPNGNRMIGFGPPSSFSSSIGIKPSFGGGASAGAGFSIYKKQACYNSPTFKNSSCGCKQ